MTTANARRDDQASSLIGHAARRAGRRRRPLAVESLERRQLLTAPPGATPTLIAAATPNETLDKAIDLGDVAATPDFLASGAIGRGAAGAADVEWYTFTLARSARLSAILGEPPADAGFRGVLSLFNSDLFDFQDPLNPSGHRLIEQAAPTSTSTAASIDRLLAPGTYYVAVSGAGNRDFHPLMAGSGLPGATGDFQLQLDFTDLGAIDGDGPRVLAAEPGAGTVLTGAPLAVRLALSSPLDASTLSADQTVRLTWAPPGGVEQPVMIGSLNFAFAADELQIFPIAPLAPGHYSVFLAGDASTFNPTLADFSGSPLGKDVDHPQGQDYTYEFDIAGVEGVAGTPAASNDTVAGARDLNDITQDGIVRVAGLIGDDPFFNPANAPDPYFPDPIYTPGNDADMYHFRITGRGRFAFVAEVFAGRIGSPLDAGVSLFRLDPVDHTLHLVGGNNNTYNPESTSDRSAIPLYNDSALYASLEAGDYYVLVAGGPNTPSPLENAPLGSWGVVDPLVAHSGQNNTSTGPYVLELLVHAAPQPPKVIATSVTDGQVLDQPPTQMVVRFNEAVNIPQLAFQTYQKTSQDTISSIYILGADGTKYFPRFMTYDFDNRLAQFRMLDALPNGLYELHLSGANGLQDLGGNPLVGNDVGGDFVVRFTVDGPSRGVSGNPLLRADVEPNESLDEAEDLGILFPRELQSGVSLVRTPSPGASDTKDVYRFDLLSRQSFAIYFAGDQIPAGLRLNLFDQNGSPVDLTSLRDGKALFGFLLPGTYFLTAFGWDASQAADLGYTIHFAINGSPTNAPPLLSGPAPAVAIHLETVSGAVPSTSTPTSLPPVAPPPSISPPGGHELSLPPATVVSGAPQSSTGSTAGKSAAEHEGTTATAALSAIVAAAPTSASAAEFSSLAALGHAPLGGATGLGSPSIGQAIMIAGLLPSASTDDPTAEPEPGDSQPSVASLENSSSPGLPDDGLPRTLSGPPGGFTVMMMVPIVIPQSDTPDFGLESLEASEKEASSPLVADTLDVPSESLGGLSEAPAVAVAEPVRSLSYLTLAAAGFATVLIAGAHALGRRGSGQSDPASMAARPRSRQSTIGSAMRLIPRIPHFLLRRTSRSLAATIPAAEPLDQSTVRLRGQFTHHGSPRNGQ